MMRRREFLSLPAAVASSKPAFSLEAYFRRIVAGYRAAARATSASGAVVEFPHATVTKGFLARSGLSVTGVTRMMPALAAWVAGGHDDGSALKDVEDALRNGTNPAHADYWQAAAEGRSDQRQVEASVVAWSVWLLRDRLLSRLTPEERKNLAVWLASCTRQKVRGNNWAWFTAVVQAASLALNERWPEFQGDEKEMLADLEFLDTLAAGESGWYNDDPHGAAFDYYNAWVFASHFLYWNEIAGARYPALRRKFGERLEKYLELAPHFFAADGRHVLYGRSLIYRWGVLTPMALAYRQKIWPHPPGLLRRLVTRNIAWHARNGALDELDGKLRETYTPAGSASVKEPYIDGGHPYWGMQAFAFWALPGTDPFWSAPEMPLPVERGDFRIPAQEAGLLFVGSKGTGEVRFYNTLSTRTEPHYRDKYNKHVYSSHHAFTANLEPGRPTLDNALLLSHGGRWAQRGSVLAHTVTEEGVRMSYELRLDGVRVVVETEIVIEKDGDRRRHVLTVEGPAEGFEMVEGSAASAKARPKVDAVEGWRSKDWTPCPGSITNTQASCWALRAPLAETVRLESRHHF